MSNLDLKHRTPRGTGGTWGEPRAVCSNLLFLGCWAARAGSRRANVSPTAHPRACGVGSTRRVSCPVPHLPRGGPPSSALPAQPIPPGPGMPGEGLQPGWPPGTRGALPPMALALCPQLGGEPQLLFLAPWEVLWGGGQEHPDLVLEVLEVLSLGWVEHTHAQGTAVVGMERDVLNLAFPSLLPGVHPLLVPIPASAPIL